MNIKFVPVILIILLWNIDEQWGICHPNDASNPITEESDEPSSSTSHVDDQNDLSAIGKILLADGQAITEATPTEIVLKEEILLISTLDGKLSAVGKRSGQLKWSRLDEPLVKLPPETVKSISPLFLPDPKDGSLYLYGARGDNHLKKLPLKIPDLVRSSPCKSSDGTFYAGKKKDSWSVLNSQNGCKDDVMNMNPLKDEQQCPLIKGSSVFLGKSEYSLEILDSATLDKWNVTFVQYSASKMDDKTLRDYEMAHFSSSSGGEIITVNKNTGSVLWSTELKSPIMGLYEIVNSQLVAVPFTSVSKQTLYNLAERFSVSDPHSRLNPKDTLLYDSLYIGEFDYGMYALRSLVDDQTPRITPSQMGPPLLEGKGGSSPKESNRGTQDLNIGEMLPVKADRQKMVILYGHYHYPDKFPYSVSPVFQITNQPESTVPISISTEAPTISDTQPFSFRNALNDFYNVTKEAAWIIAILIFFVFNIFIYVKLSRIDKHSTREFSNMSNSSRDSESYQVTAKEEDLGDGIVRVGKICFNVNDLLGKGCEGTFVYRGKFDCRDVAIKRMLPECFTFADREVDLLRESDEHPNVIRYFCMEQGRQFRYIALELCAYSLQKYVEEGCSCDLSNLTILEQAVSGLAHLHSLDIVHRDIKPQNILVSMKNSRGQVKVMISDFGLCKKLKTGRASLSKRSGLAGTEGYIAPEVLEDKRATSLLDIFSLGCVFYYVLSKGKHPFGESLFRQTNILSGKIDVSNLKDDEDCLSINLVKLMLKHNPIQRPTARAVLMHPLFWKNDRILRFFQDVSDRVEKENQDSFVLMYLERNARQVTKGNWKQLLDDYVSEDLRRFRTYNGNSVKDLLRALRNKLHHYRELPDAAKLLLGKIPDEFAQYWVARFPRLLLHSWLAMHAVKTEPVFLNYFDKEYDFVPIGQANKFRLGPGYQDESTYVPRRTEEMKAVEPNFLEEKVDLKKRVKKKPPKRDDNVPWIMDPTTDSK